METASDATPNTTYRSGTRRGANSLTESRQIASSAAGFAADQRVVTTRGLIKIADLVSRSGHGEGFDVYNKDITSTTDPQVPGGATGFTRYVESGLGQILQLGFSDGTLLRCTRNQLIWTENRGWVAASLLEDDQVVKSIQYSPRTMSTPRLPGAARGIAHDGVELTLPHTWDDELAHYLGWIVGDGCLTSAAAVTVYGNRDDKSAALPRHRELLRNWTRFDAKPSVQRNGTLQLRSGKLQVRLFLRALGVTEGKSAKKRVPSAIFEAPEDALIGFLQGLFDADGCVVNDVKKGTRYVGLGSKSEGLLRDVQELLASLGIAGRIYETASKKDAFKYTCSDGTERTYCSAGKSYDLRITGRSLAEFAARVHFTVESKMQRLTDLVDNHGFYNKPQTVTLVRRDVEAPATTYTLVASQGESYVVGGLHVGV